jgi:4-hydroxy-tetrahydrodipicolinate reductase
MWVSYILLRMCDWIQHTNTQISCYEDALLSIDFLFICHTMINVGLFGFGKAGRAVATVLLESDFVDLKWIVRRSGKLKQRSISEFLGIQSNGQGLIYSAEEFRNNNIIHQIPVDVIVDFSSQDGVDLYLQDAINHKITVVSAISEYSEDKILMLQKASKSTIVIHSPNITIGINFLLIAAKILKQIAPYVDIEIIEEHFKQKPEVSGTGKIIASKLGVNTDNIKSIRAGGIVGRHEILFGFPYQTVRLMHESISREAFGNGILFAIQNLPDAENGFFNMEDILKPFFKIEQ